MAGSLFVVATPIGNLEDITYRAVRVLGEVDLIACEDTRHTRKLLDHFKIHKHLVSYHDHNEISRSLELVESLKQGKNIALVSDAGTPLLSDPGYRIIHAAIDAGVRVIAVPGPSALLSALTVAGQPADSFYFGGFLPAKVSQRKRRLEELRELDSTLVIYEAPHRILETLSDIGEILGNRRVVLCRELTKMHEEVLRGTAEEISAILTQRDAIKGEITLVLGKPQPVEESLTPATMVEEVARLVASGSSRMDAVKSVARRAGLGKREVYALLQREQRNS